MKKTCLHEIFATDESSGEGSAFRLALLGAGGYLHPSMMPPVFNQLVTSLGTMATQNASDYVTVASAQTITGTKTFNSSDTFPVAISGAGGTNLLAVGNPSNVPTISAYTSVFASTTLQFQHHGGATAFGGSVSITGTLSTTGTATIGGDIIGSASELIIRRNTSDGSDTGAAFVCGGGGASVSRGGIISAYGNEHAEAGGVIINAGAAGGTVKLQLDGATKIEATSSGASITGTLSTTGAATFGTGASTFNVLANGANSGTNGGSNFIVQNAGSSIIGIGNRSSILGGAYDATPTLWANAPISVDQSVSVAGNITATGTIKSTLGGSGGSDSAFVAEHAAGPKYGWNVTGQSANGRLWDAVAIGNQWSLRAVNDALSAAGTAIRVSRTAAAIDSVEHIIGGTVRQIINSSGQSITGNITATGSVSSATCRVSSQFEIGDGSGDSARFLNVSNSSRSARISVDPSNTGSNSQFDLYVDGIERAKFLNGKWTFTGAIEGATFTTATTSGYQTQLYNGGFSAFRLNGPDFYSADVNAVTTGTSASARYIRLTHRATISFMDYEAHGIEVSPSVSNNNAANVSFFAANPNFQSGQSIMYIANRVAAPSGNPSGGGFLYAESGSLRWRGSSGTVTTIAVA